MAYIQDANDPTAEQAQGAPSTSMSMNQLPQTSTGTGAGATAATTSPAASPQGAAAVPASTKAPPVQDLQAYLAANAPQAVQMGQNIAGNLNTEAGKVAGDINAGQQQIDQTIQAGDIAPNPTLVGEAAQNPSEFVQNPQNVSDFLSQSGANYSGPSTFESTPQSQELTTEVQNAQQQAPNVNEPAGIQQLVAGQEQNPTTGMENLDALLLEENPNAVAPIQAALPQFGALGTQLTGATTTDDVAIQKAISDDQAAQAGVQSSFFTGPNAEVPAFQKGVSNELQTDIGQTNAYNDAVNGLIAAENGANPDFSSVQEAVQAYNDALKSDLSAPDVGNVLQGIQAAKPQPINMESITNPALLAQPTLAQAATPQDIATQNALEELLGKGFSPDFDTTGITPFQSPGTNPTLQSVLNPIIGNLEPQVETANPNVFNYSPTGGVQKNVNYPANIESALLNLKGYLGEAANPGGGSGTPPSYNPSAIPVDLVTGLPINPDETGGQLVGPVVGAAQPGA